MRDWPEDSCDRREEVEYGGWLTDGTHADACNGGGGENAGRIINGGVFGEEGCESEGLRVVD